jgi:hypothetical protein
LNNCCSEKEKFVRQFNVYSPVIVVVPNETFEWVLNPSESNQLTVQSSNWPLPAQQYTVTAGTALQVTVPSNATAGSYQFSCTPNPAPNVTSQQFIVAALEFINPCNDVDSIAPGQYFVWKNSDASRAVTIVPDPSNPDFWPIGDQHHVIEAGGHHVVQIPANATPDRSYNLQISYEGGGACAEATQPKIIVSGSGLDSAKS